MWQGFCDKCGKIFPKSKFNPYISTCPDCRQRPARKRRHKVGYCGVCAKYLSAGEWRSGMFWCPACEADYATIEGGYWIDRRTDRLWYRDQPLGYYERYNDYRRLIDEHRRLPAEGAGAGQPLQVVGG